MATYKNQVIAFCAVAILANQVGAAMLSVGIESDLSKPTFGMHQPTSSHITYNNREGLNVQGTLGDLLGPPIKIAQGLSTMINGTNMAGMGQSLKAGGAILGVDAKLLEAAGGAKLLKGGLLAGGTAAKTGMAAKIAGLPGKKIANIVEVPVKVIAMKDLVAGQTMVELGRSRGQLAEQKESRGDKMIQQGNTLRAQGMNQIVQGATQGLQNIGNAVQQTTGNAATALKLLPIMLDINGNRQTHSTQEKTTEQRHESPQQEEKGGQQLHPEQQMRQSNGGLTGGSLFGGLGSLFPGMNAGASDPLAALGSNNSEGQHRPQFPFANLFGGANQQHHYAAVLNATNPLTSLLMNPNMNPFLLPLNGAMDPMSNPMAGPLTQSFGGQTTQGDGLGSGNTHSILGNGFGFGFGGHNNNNNHGNTQTQSFNLLPGLKFSETISNGPTQQHTQQHQAPAQEKV